MRVKVAFEIEASRLAALSALLNDSLTPAAEPTPVQAPAAEEPIPAAEPAPAVQEPVTQYTKDQVLDKASGLVRTHRAEIKALLTKYNAAAISKIDPKHYDAVMADLEALNG